MFGEFLDWLLGVASTVSVAGAVIAAAGYLMRDTVARFFSKAIENRFDEKLERFKASIRDNEKELGEIRSFLMSAQRERDSVFQAKRLEAAESLLRARDMLSQFSMLVEYMKILKTDQILKDGENPKIVEFAETLIKPFKIDENLESLKSLDKVKTRLYLSEKSLSYYDAYQTIILDAVMMMKIFSIPLRDKDRLMKRGNLSKVVIDLFPNSKDSFDKWGEEHAYYWATFFHDEVLKALRHEVSGVDDLKRDTESAKQLAVESRNAQITVRSTLEKAGLPESLINSGDAIPDDPTAVAG